MRILIGADTYPPDINGASCFAHRLALGLAGRGHDVHVLHPSQELHATHKRRAGLTLHGLPAVPVPSHPTFRLPAPALLMRRVLWETARVAPDLVHVQGHFFIGRTLLRLAGEIDVPTVATNHFMPENLLPYLHLPAGAERMVSRLGWRDCVRVLSGADVVTTPTPFAARLLKEEGLQRRTLPISCGVDTSRFDSCDPAAFREKYRLAEGYTFGYVGRLDKEKRVGDLILALPIVRHSVDARLLVVGDGHEREALERLAAKTGVRGQVRFTGFVPDADLPGAYAACDVFCNASIAELQSIVTLEAMAASRPVVTADAGALPHLAHEGVNGHTFLPGDIGALAFRLISLLTDGNKRQAMGRESRRIVAEHGLEASLDSYEQAYDLATALAIERLRCSSPSMERGRYGPRRKRLPRSRGPGKPGSAAMSRMPGGC